MITPHLTQLRPVVSVTGAEEALATFTGLRGHVAPGVAARRALAGTSVRWADVRDAVLASKTSVILAGHHGGPMLGARALPTTEPTTIHDHGVAGAAVVVEGRVHYERFVGLDDDRARLDTCGHLAFGDSAWWGNPPGDLHRMTGIDGTAIALMLMDGPPLPARPRIEVPRAQSAMRDAVEAAWLAGDATALTAWYDEQVLLDVNVPEWRFQERGRGAVLHTLDTESFLLPDRRTTYLRTTITAMGVLLEVETRFRHERVQRQFREVHQLRCRDGLITEHVVWCGGIVEEAAIREQQATAPMEQW